MFTSNILSLVISLIFLTGLFILGRLSFGFVAFALLAIGGVINTAAIFNFITSLEIGEVSIVTPISASYSVITVILAVLVIGERLSFLRTFSVIIILTGIILTSTDIRKIRHIPTAKGVKEAIIALFGWGVYFFIIGLAANGRVGIKIDFLNMFALTGVINSFMTSLFAASRGGIPKLADFKIKKITLLFIINTFLYIAAWFALNYGISLDFVSLVAPVSSLYPAITVVLAVLFFREKLLLNQKIGIIIVLLGIFLISI